MAKKPRRGDKPAAIVSKGSDSRVADGLEPATCGTVATSATDIASDAEPVAAWPLVVRFDLRSVPPVVGEEREPNMVPDVPLDAPHGKVIAAAEKRHHERRPLVEGAFTKPADAWPPSGWHQEHGPANGSVESVRQWLDWKLNAMRTLAGASLAGDFWNTPARDGTRVAPRQQDRSDDVFHARLLARHLQAAHNWPNIQLTAPNNAILPAAIVELERVIEWIDSNSDPKPAAQTKRVKLYGEGQPIKIDGKPFKGVTGSAYKMMLALVTEHPKFLSGKELNVATGLEDARSEFKRLKKREGFRDVLMAGSEIESQGYGIL